jgi:hypothetical protein
VKIIKNAQFQSDIQNGQNADENLKDFILKIVLKLQDIWRIRDIIVDLLEKYLEVDDQIVDKFKKDCAEEEIKCQNNTENCIISPKGDKAEKRQRILTKDDTVCKKSKLDDNLTKDIKKLDFNGVTDIINNNTGAASSLTKINPRIGFKNNYNNIVNDVASVGQNMGLINSSNNITNNNIVKVSKNEGLINNYNYIANAESLVPPDLGEVSNPKNTITNSNISLKSENTNGTSYNFHMFDPHKNAINLSNQKSTNLTDITLPNNKEQDCKYSRGRGINLILQGNLINRPKARKEKPQINNSKKKNGAASQMLKLFKQKEAEINETIQFVNTSDQNTNVKGISQSEFYKKSKAFAFNNQVENNSNLSNNPIIYPEPTKYSKRAKSPRVNVVGKYDNILFNRNKIGRMKSVKNDNSSVKSLLSDDEIICENTPTKLDQFKFMKKSPSRNDIIKNYGLVLTQLNTKKL